MVAKYRAKLFGLYQPNRFVYEDVTYEINAVDSNGCVNENLATITVKVDDELALFVPDAFTPNGDGMNDVLLVYGVNLVDAQISIYNRWVSLCSLVTLHISKDGTAHLRV